MVHNVFNLYPRGSFTITPSLTPNELMEYPFVPGMGVVITEGTYAGARARRLYVQQGGMGARLHSNGQGATVLVIKTSVSPRPWW
jgi:hypothetical protein